MASVAAIRRLPGFRTRQAWKQIFATIGYIAVIAFSATAILDRSDSQLSITTYLRNGGFESGSTYWDLAPQATIDDSSVDAHSGHMSLRLNATKPWQASVQTIRVDAGQPYDFAGWGRSTAGDGHFSIFSYASSGALLTPAFDRVFQGTGKWIRVAAVYVPPLGAVRAQILLQNASPGSYWFDDVGLVRGDNAISNPGFEDGADNWSVSPHATVVSSSIEAHSGNQALKLVATGAWQETFQSITVVGGHIYGFSGWGRSTSSGGHMSLITFDANNIFIDTFDLVFGQGGDWRYVSGVYIPPPTAARVEVALQSANAGTYWFDDVRLAPTTSVIDNGGFEQGVSGWRLGQHATIETSASEAHGGRKFLLVRADAPWQGASQSPPIRESETYAIQGWGRSIIDGGHITIVSLDARGHEIGRRVDITFPGTRAWVRFTGSYRPPPGTVRIDLWLQNAVSGEFAFDDVSMTPK